MLLSAQYSLLFAAIAFLLAALSMQMDRRLRWASVVAFACYLGFDDLVTAAPTVMPAIAIDAGQWNWAGKTFSLVFGLLTIAAFRLPAEQVGLVLPRRALKSSVIALVLFVLWGLLLGHVFAPDPPSAETLLFQAFMPGLAEELAYRGVAPALLFAFSGSWPRKGEVPWAVVVSTAIMFGLWHGLDLAAAGLHFDPWSALYPLCGSLASGWLRFRSGSLLFPMLAHAGANLAFHLSAIV